MTSFCIFHYLALTKKKARKEKKKTNITGITVRHTSLGFLLLLMWGHLASKFYSK